MSSVRNLSLEDQMREIASWFEMEIDFENDESEEQELEYEDGDDLQNTDFEEIQSTMFTKERLKDQIIAEARPKIIDVEDQIHLLFDTLLDSDLGL